jgi:phosphoglucosamine mutase
MAENLFGTDGIRDIAGKGYLAPEFIIRISRTIGRLMREEPRLFSRGNLPSGGLPKKVLLARDTRPSGRMIESALSAGILCEAFDIISVGVVPTPVCSFLTKRLDCGVGIMVSASHNPTEYNGIKLFDSEGYKVKDELEERIENIVASKKTRFDYSPQTGKLAQRPDALKIYIDETVSAAKRKFSLKGMKIVLDCAFGALSEVAPEIFSRLGADVIAISSTPDGDNINRDSGALFPQFARRKLIEEKADIAFSFDGDGDRVIAIDETGCERDGDYIMAICAEFLKDRGELAANTVVTTVMSNIGLELFLKEKGIALVRTKVGDRFVAEEMLRLGAVLGGEQSGHIMFFNDAPTGDAAWTALNLLRAIKETSKPLSELSRGLTKYPQILINVAVCAKPPLLSVPEIKSAVAQAEEELGESGRILLRYSGTEPLARVMLEGKSQSQIKCLADSIASAIRKTLGTPSSGQRP